MKIILHRNVKIQAEVGGIGTIVGGSDRIRKNGEDEVPVRKNGEDVVLVRNRNGENTRNRTNGERKEKTLLRPMANTMDINRGRNLAGSIEKGH